MYNNLQELSNKVSYLFTGDDMENFESWWATYKYRNKDERAASYSSLTRREQFKLRESFLQDGWCELFCQNHIDKCLDLIKSIHSIDLLDLRIKALKQKRVFLIPRNIWEEIEHMILEYEPLFNSDIIFGGLTTKPWGKLKQFIVVSAQRRKIDV